MYIYISTKAYTKSGRAKKLEKSKTLQQYLGDTFLQAALYHKRKKKKRFHNLLDARIFQTWSAVKVIPHELATMAYTFHYSAVSILFWLLLEDTGVEMSEPHLT